MDVKTRCNSTLELLERAYQLQEFTIKWLQNPKYSEYRLLFATLDEWTMVKYVMDGLRPFPYWTLWMSRRHSVTFHYVITVYNDMFDSMDGIMWALAKKKTQWREDLFFTVKLARQKLSNYYAEVTPSTAMHLISAHILDPFRKLRLSWRWDKGIDINPEDETFYTTQYQEASLKYVENQYCAKHQRVAVNKPDSVLMSDLVPSAMASRSGQSSLDSYDLSSDDQEYLTPNDGAQTTPGWSDWAAWSLPAARLYLNPLPEAPKNSGQINPNLNDYHSDRMEISSTCLIPDIADWWRHQEETHSKYADLSNVVRDIFSIIPHGVGVEASFSLGRDVISWRQSKPTGETLCEKAVVRLFAWANNSILALRPSIGYDEHKKWLGNEERGGGKEIAQNGQGPQLCGDAAGQPKPTRYTDGISCSKQANDCRRIHFGPRRYHQSAPFTLWTWWCGCINIVRKITFATSFVCQGPPGRTNSIIERPPNQKNGPSSSRKWWG